MGKKDSIAAPACIQCFKAATLWSFMVDFIVMVGCIFGVYQLSTSIDIKFGRYINYQLSTINYQLSTININFSRKTFVLRPSWAHDFWAQKGPWSIHPSSRSGDSVEPQGTEKTIVDALLCAASDFCSLTENNMCHGQWIQYESI